MKLNGELMIGIFKSIQVKAYIFNKKSKRNCCDQKQKKYVTKKLGIDNETPAIISYIAV